jgi:hypothetical protein
MARNVYISNGVKSEQDLYEELIVEAMQIYGTDVYYIPRVYYSIDTILNEDTLSKFEAAFKIEMYIESIDGLEGDGKLYSKFGFEIRDQITFAVSRRRWNQLIGHKGSTGESVRPREGDLIYIPLSKGLFEIRYVEDKKPFFQVKNVPTFKLTCENFEYSNQEINTGIEEVDKLQRTSSTMINAVVEFTGSERHELSEKLIIELPSGVTGYTELLEYMKDGDDIIERMATLNFDDGQFHQLTVGTTLTGENSGFVSTITTLFELSDTSDLSNDNDFENQNSNFELEGNTYIDFSETNPFGEPNDA